MDEQTLRTLVEGIVRAILAGKPPAIPTVSPGTGALILVGGAAEGIDDATAALSAMSDQAGSLYVSQCHRNRFPAGPITARFAPGVLLDRDAPLESLENVVRRADKVVWLQPEIAPVVRLSLGMPQTRHEQLVWTALASGRRVYTAGGQLDPSNLPATMPAPMRVGSQGISGLLAEALQRLSAWGLVHREKAAELVPLLAGKPVQVEAKRLLPLTIHGAGATTPRRFVVSEDIYSAREQGLSRYQAPAGSIVTDQARDLAQSLEIEIVESP